MASGPSEKVLGRILSSERLVYACAVYTLSEREGERDEGEGRRWVRTGGAQGATEREGESRERMWSVGGGNVHLPGSESWLRQDSGVSSGCIWSCSGD